MKSSDKNLKKVLKNAQKLTNLFKNSQKPSKTELIIRISPVPCEKQSQSLGKAKVKRQNEK